MQFVLSVRKGNGGLQGFAVIVLQENTVIHAHGGAMSAKRANTRIRKVRPAAHLVQRASTKVKKKKKVAMVVVLVSIPTN